MGPLLYVTVAFPCTIGAITLVILHIYKHLLNYTEPTYQRYIVRIIFMVPVSRFYIKIAVLCYLFLLYSYYILLSQEAVLNVSWFVWVDFIRNFMFCVWIMFSVYVLFFLTILILHSTLSIYLFEFYTFLWFLSIGFRR